MAAADTWIEQCDQIRAKCLHLPVFRQEAEFVTTNSLTFVPAGPWTP